MKRSTQISQRHPAANAALMFLVFALLVPPISAATFGVGDDTFDMSFVEIGDPGNTADPATGYGRVDTTFYMSTYEVSRDMIDTYNNVSGDPEISMFDYAGGGVTGGNLANRPATGVTWNEAARFVNWLNIESGSVAAYQFSGAVIGANIVLWESGDIGYDVNNPYRNSGANFFLPSENEWYKTAYYDSDTAGYNLYTTSNLPSPVASGTDPDTAVFELQSSDGPAVVSEAGGVGPHGTIGMGGNVWEWTESSADGVNDDGSEARSLRGGSWVSASVAVLASTVRVNNNPNAEVNGNGFRVASLTGIPEPGAAALLLFGSGVFALRRRRGR